MKQAIYISGFMSAFLYVGWIFAIAIKLPRHLFFLIPALIISLGIYLPLTIKKQRQHKARMAEIIEKYQANKEKDERDDAQVQQPAGWSMNDSPFRSRKSGLEWGGGNIRASEASRQSRRRFLKK